VVNLLSPAPWLFWITVGAPTLVTAWRVRPTKAVGFLSLFVLALVGSGLAIVLATSALGWRRLGRATSLLLLAGIALLVKGLQATGST